MCVLHGRARIGVTEPILACCHRHVLSVHDRLVSVPERVEARTLDPQLLQQRMEFALPNDVRVPRSSVARREEQTQDVRSPGAKESAKMLRELRGDLAETIALLRLH